MPTYKFHDKNTDKIWEEMMTISESDIYMESNPHIERIPNGYPAIIDPMRIGMKKPDDSFRDLLRNMKKHNPRSTINSF